MKIRALLTTLALTAALTACGIPGHGVSGHDKQVATDFCASQGDYMWTGMHLDQYKNADGFDRCVENASKVVDCLGPGDRYGFVPPNCDNKGYMP